MLGLRRRLGTAAAPRWTELAVPRPRLTTAADGRLAAACEGASGCVPDAPRRIARLADMTALVHDLPTHGPALGPRAVLIATCTEGRVRSCPSLSLVRSSGPDNGWAELGTATATSLSYPVTYTFAAPLILAPGQNTTLYIITRNAGVLMRSYDMNAPNIGKTCSSVSGGLIVQCGHYYDIARRQACTRPRARCRRARASSCKLRTRRQFQRCERGRTAQSADSGGPHSWLCLHWHPHTPGSSLLPLN